MMRPDMVYQFPIWAVGLSLAILAVIGTILLELGVRYFVSAAFRRQHNDSAAAIFSIIGVTYAVLLPFVAMLAWDGFNKAKAAITWRLFSCWMSLRRPMASPSQPNQVCSMA